jgi:hypothetical protein
MMCEFLAAAALAALIIGINVLDHRQRITLSAQQREAEDVVIRREMQIW